MEHSGYDKYAYSNEIQKNRNSGDITSAIDICKRAIVAFPTNNFYHKVLGDMYLQIGDLQNASMEYINNLRLIQNNSDLFKNFVKFYKRYEKRASIDEIDSFKSEIKKAIENHEISEEIVQCLIAFFGYDFIVDDVLLNTFHLTGDDKNLKLVRAFIEKCINDEDISTIRAIINYTIKMEDDQRNKNILSYLLQSAKKLGIYTDALSLSEVMLKRWNNLQMTWNMLRLCRKLGDYAVAEKNLQLDERYIEHSDFNNQYELVYYFEKKGDNQNLFKTLKKMRTSATRSIPIARTLYNFYLRFERFDEAQEIYEHIQSLFLERRADKEKKRLEEEQETEQAVWQKLKDLVSEQEHNRQLVAMRDLLKGFSHELGQPITNIRFAVQLHQLKLEHGLDDVESTKVLLESILKQTSRIGTLLARFRPIVSSKSTIEKFNIYECVEEVFHDLETRLTEQNIKYTISKRHDVYLFGEKIQFSQVLYNLVLNSMQAMVGSGNISVELTQRGNKAYLTFSDTGPGIAPENYQKIFEPFFSTKEKEPSNDSGGEGLGLFIVWNILKMFNGSISIDKDYHSGARFIICIPIKEVVNDGSSSYH